MHKLLRRQLRQAQADGAVDLATLIALVDAAYEEVDRERRFTEHTHQVLHDEQMALAARQVETHANMAQIRAEKAEAERARAVAEAALLKRERLSVLGQLTATVAHELRNPLSAIRNSVYAIREFSGGGASLERPMMRIERNIKRCDSIINDLLDYARTREIKTQPVSLDAWLGEVLDDQSIPDGVTIERRFGALGTVVALDEERFRRVVNNLLENAIQALAEDGGAAAMRVVVTTSASIAAEIVIADTGPGMPPAVLDRIFEPLFSTKSFGTGLGLPTVKQIVEQHQGTIAVASAVGAGTRVEIRLPLAAAARLPASAA